MNPIRRAHPRWRAALVVALAAASVTTPVLAHDPDPALGGGTYDQNQALEFRWRSGSEPPSAIRSAVLAAAGDSNASRASRAATRATPCRRPRGRS